MGEEVFDQLDVVRRDADEVSGAPPREVGWRQRVELPENVETHVGQQAIRHVVGEP